MRTKLKMSDVGDVNENKKITVRTMIFGMTSDEVGSNNMFQTAMFSMFCFPSFSNFQGMILKFDNN